MHIFLDTNILLHFQSFETIPWNEIFEKEIITLCFAPIVIQELDQLKYLANGKIRKKAKIICNKIEKFRIENNNISSTLKVEIRITKPNKNTFKDNYLPMYDKDNELLATILEYKEKISDEVVLVTNDTGPRLKAESLNIICAKISEKYFLTPEKSSLEKEILKLKLENEKLKNISPKLIVTFENGVHNISYDVEHSVHNLQGFTENRIDAIKRKYPQIEFTPQKEPKTVDHPIANAMATYLDAFSIYNPKKEDYDKYNENLEKFYSQYEEYLTELYNYKYQSELNINLTLFLLNEGTAPADNIDVKLTFPDGFEIMEKDEWKNFEPTSPSIPSKPKSKNIMDSIITPSLNNLYNIHRPNDFEPVNISDPTIKKTNSYDVSLNVKYLKHTQNVSILNLVIIFESYEKIKNFSIQYSIIAANIPTEENGTLNVLLNKIN